MMTISGLSVKLDVGLVLNAVSARIEPGTWVSMVGPNGAGKSTLLKAIAGILPYQGEICIDGQNLAELPRKLRAQRIAWLSQDGEWSGEQSVFELVMLGRLPHQTAWGAPSKDDEQAVQAALEQTGAWPWRARLMRSLSGGQRQRVLFARALALGARLLLLDEPLTYLDPPQQAECVALIRAHVAAGGTVLSVLHDLSVALQADQLMIVDEGRIRFHASTQAADIPAALSAVFAGRVRVLSVDGQQVALLT